jgi:hypothetical protein
MLENAPKIELYEVCICIICNVTSHMQVFHTF